MNTLMHLSRWTGVALVGSLLVACGGDFSPEGFGPDASIDGVTVPASVHSSENLVAFNLLNAERIRCGFGGLQQSQPLDRAANAHAKWTLLNNRLSHVENGIEYANGYTGASAADRVSHQNYPLGSTGDASEVFTAFHNMPAHWSLGASAVRLLLNAPYHLATLTGPYRDVGVSVQTPAGLGLLADFSPVVMELGRAQDQDRQDLLPGVVATYPCEGSSGVMYNLSDERPNPIPGRNLGKNPLGTTIIVRVGQGQSLVIDRVAVSETDTGVSVTMRDPVGGVNGTSDPEGVFTDSVAFTVADAPMRPQTSYTAQISGTNNGQSFNTTFKFTTGSVSFGAPSQ